MKYSPYPRYKPSGIDWLGEVPEHWEVKRLKTSARYCVSNVDKVPSGDELPVRLCNYTDVYYHEHIGPGMGLMETTATADEILRFGLRVGDVLITKDSEEWSDIGVPALVVETSADLLCGYHLALIRPEQEKLLGSFLLRALQSSAINQQFQVAATGITRYGLPKSAIGEASLPLPPPEEQQVIADFLNTETTKIDALVAKKERLIELLQEKRAALINRVVSSGLNLGAPMHVTQLSWLGAIPNHWAVTRLKFALQEVEQGWSPLCDNRPAEVDEWGVLKVGCVNGTRFNPEEHKALPRDVEPLAELEIKPGDILVSRANTRELLGSAALVSEVRPRLLLCDKLYRLKSRSTRLDPSYLVHLLGSSIARFQLERDATGASSSMQNIGQDTIRNMVVCIPPLDEQPELVRAIEQENKKADDLVATIRKHIEKLTEYRAALISAAVTGKIDVRGEAEA